MAVLTPASRSKSDASKKQAEKRVMHTTFWKEHFKKETIIKSTTSMGDIRNDI
jgi:hypothetical protein